MRLLIPPGKENKKSFRDLVALEQGLEDREYLSLQQRQDRKFQIKTPSTELHTYNKHKNSVSFK